MLTITSIPSAGDHERHYFHCLQTCDVTLPAGKVTLDASHGFGHTFAHTVLDVTKGALTATVILKSNPLPAEYGSFVSADMHVHMNYGGQYQQTLKNLAKVAKAEDLDIIYNLIVNKEERIPDIAQFKTTSDTFDGVTLYQGQEYHSSYWGHMGLLHLDDHYLTPDFASYWDTAIASPYPDNSVINDLAHKQRALTGYVHLYDGVPNPDKDVKLTHALPVDAALGKTDYIEVVGFADHKDAATVWYRLLNLGLKITAGAGTDAMTNYASLRGPVGLNRMFIDGAKADDPDSLRKAIKAGHGFASNAPQLGLLVEGTKPGDTLSLGADGGPVHVKAALRTSVPVEKFELVMNGKVIKSFPVGADSTGVDIEATVDVPSSGWLLVRAYRDAPHIGVQDIYTYATTNPVWVSVNGTPQKAPEDAEYFIKWLDRIAEHAGARTDYNSPWERDAVLADIAAARKIYEGKLP